MEIQARGRPTRGCNRRATRHGGADAPPPYATLMIFVVGCGCIPIRWAARPRISRRDSSCWFTLRAPPSVIHPGRPARCPQRDEPWARLLRAPSSSRRALPRVARSAVLVPTRFAPGCPARRPRLDAPCARWPGAHRPRPDTPCARLPSALCRFDTRATRSIRRIVVVTMGAAPGHPAAGSSTNHAHPTRRSSCQAWP